MYHTIILKALYPMGQLPRSGEAGYIPQDRQVEHFETQKTPHQAQIYFLK